MRTNCVGVADLKVSQTYLTFCGVYLWTCRDGDLRRDTLLTVADAAKAVTLPTESESVFSESDGTITSTGAICNNNLPPS